MIGPKQCGLALVGLVLGTSLWAQDAPSGLDVALALESTLTKAIERAEKSVVAIARGNTAATGQPWDARDEQPPTDALSVVPGRYGSGVVVDASGLILTNYHVIDDQFTETDGTYYRLPNELQFSTQPKVTPAAIRTTIWVATAERRWYRAQVVAADPRSDLAVLRIAAPNLTPITFAPAERVDNLRKGQFVIALGNPDAIARDGSPTAAWGMVANTRRKLRPELDESGRSEQGEVRLHHYGGLIQTDTKLNYNTSGGALVNLEGELIGLINALPAVPGSDASAGFAIPMNDQMQRIIETLKAGREVEYGFLGVTIRSNPVGIGGAIISPGGLEVSAQGLPRSGEQTVIAVNDTPIHDAEDLIYEIGKLGTGAQVRLTVDQNGTRRTLPTITLTKYPVRGMKIVSDVTRMRRGLVVDYPSTFPEYVASGAFRPFEVSNALRNGAVAVRAVANDSSAARAGLKHAQLVTQVADQRVRSPDEFLRALDANLGPVKLTLADGTSVVLEP